MLNVNTPQEHHHHSVTTYLQFYSLSTLPGIFFTMSNTSYAHNVFKTFIQLI
jgi:hypothetical protein